MVAVFQCGNGAAGAAMYAKERYFMELCMCVCSSCLTMKYRDRDCFTDSIYVVEKEEGNRTSSGNGNG